MDNMVEITRSVRGAHFARGGEHDHASVTDERVRKALRLLQAHDRIFHDLGLILERHVSLEGTLTSVVVEVAVNGELGRGRDNRPEPPVVLASEVTCVSEHGLDLPVSEGATIFADGRGGSHPRAKHKGTIA